MSVDLNYYCMPFDTLTKHTLVTYMFAFWTSQGLEWHHLRSKLTAQLASSALGDPTVKQVCIISDELIEKIRAERDADNILDAFEKTIYSCGLEGN